MISLEPLAKGLDLRLVEAAARECLKSSDLAEEPAGRVLTGCPHDNMNASPVSADSRLAADRQSLLERVGDSPWLFPLVLMATIAVLLFQRRDVG